MYPIANYIYENSIDLQKKDSGWDIPVILVLIILIFPVMVVTDSSTGGLGLIFYIFIIILIGWKALPGKLIHERKKGSFELEFDEILATYKKNKKKSAIQLFKIIEPKYFSINDIESICTQFEDIEIHKQISKSKKNSFTMKELKTSLKELKRDEKVFFRSQSCWTKGDPSLTHQINDYGHIYLTNLAIIFSGYNRSTRINFTRVMEIEEYEDLISVNKTSGINDNFFLLNDSVKYFMLFYKNRKKVKLKK